MGLDVNAYSGCVMVDGPEAAGRIVYIHESEWSSRMDGMEPGLYSFEESFSFRAGSYSWYNRWREWLAALVGKTPEEIWNAENPEGPFTELINFSDCEGTIGPKTSAKLLGDFEAFTARAEAFALELGPVQGGHFVAVYNEFKKAFSLAADGGFVVFC